MCFTVLHVDHVSELFKLFGRKEKLLNSVKTVQKSALKLYLLPGKSFTRPQV